MNLQADSKIYIKVQVYLKRTKAHYLNYYDKAIVIKIVRYWYTDKQMGQGNGIEN